MLSIDDAGFVPFRAWTGGRAVPTLGTNDGADALPFQGWRRFKEAFAPELVSRAITESPRDVADLADPFGGSGTSALAGQFLGACPQTIEVNPFLTDLIEAKLTGYDFEALTRDFTNVMRQVRVATGDPAALFAAAPRTFLEPGTSGRYIFSNEVAERIAALRQSIDELADQRNRRLFRVLLGGVLIPVSNVVVSGKGRRYRRGWERRHVSSLQVERLFEEAVGSAIYDLRRYELRRCREFRLIRGDARHSVQQLDPIDLAIFSPPYPNSFDYTDVYNVELWTLGYLDSPAANRQLREATLRSHVQIRRDFTANVENARLAEVVDRLDRKRGVLWNSDIPAMIGAYFADMCDVMLGLRAKLREDGRMYMVVGDSRYAGVDVPVADILAELGGGMQMRLVNSEPFRSMRVSPQQGGDRELPETLLVFQA